MSDRTSKAIDKRKGKCNRSFIVNRDLWRLYMAYRSTLLESEYELEDIIVLCDYIRKNGVKEYLSIKELHDEIIGSTYAKRQNDIFFGFTEFQLMALIDGAEMVCILEKEIGLDKAILEVFHVCTDENRKNWIEEESRAAQKHLENFWATMNDPSNDIPF